MLFVVANEGSTMSIIKDSYYCHEDFEKAIRHQNYCPWDPAGIGVVFGSSFEASSFSVAQVVATGVHQREARQRFG